MRPALAAAHVAAPPSRRCCQTFSTHVNRQQACTLLLADFRRRSRRRRADRTVLFFLQTIGMAFSPCGRFVATGSEDSSAYLYDVRTGAAVARLLGLRDVVADVAFHPRHPQLAAAGYDGNVRFFTAA